MPRLENELEEASSTGSEKTAPKQVCLLFSPSVAGGANPSAALCW